MGLVLGVPTYAVAPSIPINYLIAGAPSCSFLLSLQEPEIVLPSFTILIIISFLDVVEIIKLLPRAYLSSTSIASQEQFLRLSRELPFLPRTIPVNQSFWA